MTRALAIAVLAAFAISCGGSTKPADPTPDPAPDRGPDLGPDPGPNLGPDPDPDPDPDADPDPDQGARCTQLVDHMIDIALSESPGKDPAEIREALAGDRDRLIEDCAEGAISDAEHACAMAATTAADMEKCAPR